jgi:hypothetical protein
MANNPAASSPEPPEVTGSNAVEYLQCMAARGDRVQFQPLYADAGDWYDYPYPPYSYDYPYGWMLKSIVALDPFVWMAEVNGILVDIREMPREVQVIAYEKGMIPYIPADQG